MYKNHWPWEEKQDDPQTFKKYMVNGHGSMFGEGDVQTIDPTPFLL